MSQAAVQYLQKKQIIFYENSTDTGMYKIISGRIAFYKNYGTGDERLIGTSSAPNYFGMMSALTGEVTAYTAVALEQSAVLYLPQDQLEMFPKSDPAGALALMKTLSRELRSAERRANGLLTELRRIAAGGGEAAQEINALLERCSVTEKRILDAHEQPEVSAVVQTPEIPRAENPAAVSEKKIFAKHLPDKEETRLPDPYLEGHRGYPGITRPEDKKYLLEQELTCPHCRQKFTAVRIQTSKLVPIRNSAENRRYDLRVTYSDFEVEWHEIVTCPHCWFSAFENFFRESKSLYRSRYEGNLAKLRDTLAVSFYSEPDLDSVFAKHYLAMVCAAGFTDSRQIIARVWMNLVRLYQDAGEVQLADLAEQKALDAYQTVYREVELTEGQEQRMCLTVAGILYARGEKQAAREWAIRVRHGSNDRTAYWNMAEQLLQDVRAELEEEKAK